MAVGREPIALKAIEHIVIAEGIVFGVESGQTLDGADPQIALFIAHDAHSGVVHQAVLLDVVAGKPFGLQIETPEPGGRSNPNTVAIGIGVHYPVHSLDARLIRVQKKSRELPCMQIEAYQSRIRRGDPKLAAVVDQQWTNVSTWETGGASRVRGEMREAPPVEIVEPVVMHSNPEPPLSVRNERGDIVIRRAVEVRRIMAKMFNVLPIQPVQAAAIGCCPYHPAGVHGHRPRRAGAQAAGIIGTGDVVGEGPAIEMVQTRFRSDP